MTTLADQHAHFLSLPPPPEELVQLDDLRRQRARERTATAAERERRRAEMLRSIATGFQQLRALMAEQEARIAALIRDLSSNRTDEHDGATPHPGPLPGATTKPDHPGGAAGRAREGFVSF